MLSKIFRSGSQLTNQQQRFVSVWGHVDQAPADLILGVTEAFKKDSHPSKTLLGVGAYRDDSGKPYILESVKRAQKIVFESNADNEYAPVHGNQNFINGSIKLAYGADYAAVKENRVAGLQSLSGCGAIRIGLEFIKKYYPNREILIPNPTWPIHNNIAIELGMKKTNYRYYDPATKGLDFNGMVADIEKAPEGSVVMLHVCSHNPTGVDPSQEQWQTVKKVVLQRKHFVFFDSAYQGFTTGDVVQDAYSLRLFSKNEDIPIMLAQSFAKNFGLYGQRIGCLSTVCSSAEEADNVVSQMKGLARRSYSNPPIHGARIVDKIFSSPDLYALWLEDIKIMANRIKDMRVQLVNEIKKLGNPNNWDHITNQIGMFAFTGLKPDHVERLRNEFHIYMTADGRISIAGLNTSNVGYVAKCFHEVTKNSKI